MSASRARMPSAVLSATTSSPTTMWSSVRLQVESATASRISFVDTSSRITLTALPSGSATRSRSSTGAVLCEMPISRSPFIYLSPYREILDFQRLEAQLALRPGGLEHRPVLFGGRIARSLVDAALHPCFEA